MYLQVAGKVQEAMGEEKLDAVVCVAGGWAGGNAASPGQCVACMHKHPGLITYILGLCAMYMLEVSSNTTHIHLCACRAGQELRSDVEAKCLDVGLSCSDIIQASQRVSRELWRVHFRV